MPSAARIGDSELPHPCFTGGVISQGSPDTLFDGKPASTIGHAGTPHARTCPGGGPHVPYISGGSATVLINGKPAARIGDPEDCGSVIGSGSPTVIIG